MTESEFRDFMREQTLRHESAMRGVIRRTDEMIRRSDEEIAELRDLRQESRAQRAALFAVLDQLRSGGAPPATA